MLRKLLHPSPVTGCYIRKPQMKFKYNNIPVRIKNPKVYCKDPFITPLLVLSPPLARGCRAKAKSGCSSCLVKASWWLQRRPAIILVKPPSATGYCIRTGKPIPFDPGSPMCAEAHKSWQRFGNESYAEHYCHFTGEPSAGQTSYAKPILKKNWSKAKEVHKL